MIKKAFYQLEIWHLQGVKLELSINIAAQQLQQKDFIGRLQYQISLHPELKPEYIQFEILETRSLDDVIETAKVISECRVLGYSFALDDFGTGYSSLTYLRRLPVNLIKIDKSFVIDMLIDPDDFSIIAGIMGLTSGFDLSVIAEGVETSAHVEALLKLGCKLAQGYHIAKPMPASEFVKWSKSWEPDSSWRTVA